MDRRSDSVLLLPLLAALALFYPVAVRRPASSLAQVSGAQAELQDIFGRLGITGKKREEEEWTGGRNLVRYYLGLPKPRDGVIGEDRGKTPWGNEDSRNHTQVEFLIATLPDPADSGLPHIFDRNLDSIQSALLRAGYLPTGRYRLPWQDCLLGRSVAMAGGGDDGGGSGAETGKSDKQKQCEQDRPFAKEPGVILYAKDTSDKSEVHLLLLYLVGETPISGIQKRALRAALKEMAWFHRWSHQSEGRPKSDPLSRIIQVPKESRGMIRILGPTFSGSAPSLDFALSSWLHSLRGPLPEIRMISGSATALSSGTEIDPRGKFPNVVALYRHDPKRFSFSSMEAPDTITTCAFFDYLKQIEPHEQRLRVALLSEGGTAYGHQEKKRVCENQTEVADIKFPLQISQLRAASEKVRESQQQTAPQVGPATPGLPLSKALEEVNQPHDTMAPLSLLDPLSSEQVMGQLLSTISREQYRYIGILATDARDTMFLAQELREHAPSSVLFSFDPDLLFLHPEVNSSLRGMLVVTTYPLFTPNLLWSPPHPKDGSHPLMQFPDQGSEGTYNAALALLGQEDQLREYGLPLQAKASQPPLWITVVGRNRIWPVQVYDLRGTPAQAYMHIYDKETPEEDKKSWFRGVYPAGSVIFFVGLTLISFVLALPLLARFRASEEERQTPTPWLGGAWLESLLGEAASERRRSSGELYLLAACAFLGVLLVVALTALLGPAIVMRHPDISVWPRWQISLVLSVCTATVVVLLVAGAALLAALRRSRSKSTGLFAATIERDARENMPQGIDDRETRKPSANRRDGGENREAGEEWNLPTRVAAVGVAAALVTCAVSLSSHWLAGAHSTAYRSSFFTSLRSLDLLSGVSPLMPLLLVFIAGFLWALSSFRRVRQLERFESDSRFLAFAEPLGDIGELERQVCSQLRCSSLRLPGAWVVGLVALGSVTYLFVLRLVFAFEDHAFYGLLGVGFFAVHLALWLSVLRFCCVWTGLRRLLRHLNCGPLRAYRRFQDNLPSAYKIDLASPVPTLASLAFSVDQARTLCLQARALLQAQKQRLKVAAGQGRWDLATIKAQDQEMRWSVTELTKPLEADSPKASEWSSEQVALQRLGSDEMTNLVHEAESHLAGARAEDAKGDWRRSLSEQIDAQEALSKVVYKVTRAANDAWWEQLRSSPDKPKPAKSQHRPEDAVFRLGEDFLVGRVANFLAYVLPQMQSLIVISVTGLLLLLFAISSYPFQPHKLLLLFNWAVILSFVGIAMWVFVQMNRDPVLSNLNRTKAGKISWDWDFAFRIFLYGVVPILALFGAQFPQWVGQVLSHIVPGQAMHQ